MLFHCGKKISDIIDKIDAVKLLSSMTLFMIADEYNICTNIFLEVIKIFYIYNINDNYLDSQSEEEYNCYCQYFSNINNTNSIHSSSNKNQSTQSEIKRESYHYIHNQNNSNLNKFYNV